MSKIPALTAQEKERGINQMLCPIHGLVQFMVMRQHRTVSIDGQVMHESVRKIIKCPLCNRSGVVLP